MWIFRLFSTVLEIIWDIRHWRFMFGAATGFGAMLMVAMQLPDGTPSWLRATAMLGTLLTFGVLGAIWDGQSVR